MKITLCITAVSLLLTSNISFADDTDLLMRRANRFFAVLPETMPGSENDTPQRITLGEKLYFEKRLSINDSQSCASCHILKDGSAGVDNLATSPGAKKQLGSRNSPTVLNAGWRDSQFWDGRSEEHTSELQSPSKQA